MISAWKRFVRVVEIVSVVLLISNLISCMLIALHAEWSTYFEPLVAGSTFLMLLLGLVAGLLHSEASRVPRPTGGKWNALFGWCPKWLMAISWLTAAMLLILLPKGKVFWDFADPITAQAAVLGTGLNAFFIALCLPVIASASRMPGTYSENAALQKSGA